MTSEPGPRRPAVRPTVREPAVVILSGLSGGGKTAAAKLFEDLGYTVVDNLPAELLPDLAELVSSDRQRFARVAIVLDVRAGDAPLALAAMRGALEGRGIRPRVVFLEARDDVLIRRFSETRHRHPLGDERGIASSIAEERRLLEPIRAEADVVIDTSDLSLRELRERLFAQLGTVSRPDQLAIQLISFGFKHGMPLEADLVFDVRFMQNPFYVAELRRLSGLTEPVRSTCSASPSRRGSSTCSGVPRVRAAGLRRRRQDAADHRHRLHRRLPPLDRHRRGTRHLAARARLRSGRGLPPGARPDVNLRRWLTPGIGIKRWLLVVFVGLLLLALAFAHVLRQATRTWRRAGRRTPDRPADAAVPAVPCAGFVVRPRPRFVAVGAVMVPGVLTDPFRSDDATSRWSS